MKPVPVPDEFSAPYWEGARRGDLVVTACIPDGHLTFPPDVACAACGSRELVPRSVSGGGTVYSFTVVRQAFDTAFAPAVPYVVALIELDEQPGLRILTNIVDGDPDRVEIGDRVHVVFEPLGDVQLPQFALDVAR